MSIRRLSTSTLTQQARYATMSASEGVVAYTFEYLIVGGGGGTSPSAGYGSGAGGGGYRAALIGENSGRGNTADISTTLSTGTSGLFAERPVWLQKGESVSVSVGGGGAANASNGGNSSFAGLVAIGGGRGANTGAGYTAGNGGCGGSGPNQGLGTTDQGYDGVGDGGFGHGGGGAGSGPSSSTGGSGIASSVTGSSVTRAAGGGGEYGPANSTPANSGNGAKSGSNAGASGVVVLRYPKELTLTVGAGLTSSTTESGDYKVTTFTAGTDTVTVG